MPGGVVSDEEVTFNYRITFIEVKGSTGGYLSSPVLIVIETVISDLQIRTAGLYRRPLE